MQQIVEYGGTGMYVDYSTGNTISLITGVPN